MTETKKRRSGPSGPSGQHTKARRFIGLDDAGWELVDSVTGDDEQWTHWAAEAILAAARARAKARASGEGREE